MKRSHIVRVRGRFTFLLLLVSGGVCAALGGVPVVKASVEEPVLEELMGGCSLKCAFPWSVEALSPAGKWGTIKALNDESAQNAWVADAAAGRSGVGARLRLAFPRKLAPELEGATPLYGLDLINGHWKTETLWKQHARVRKARLFYNQRPLCDIAFADNRRWQRVTFPDVFVRSGDSMMLEILEIYPGEKGGVAVSEIVLQGGH